MDEDPSITPVKALCVELVRTLGQCYLPQHLRSRLAAEKARLESLLQQLEGAQRERRCAARKMRCRKT